MMMTMNEEHVQIFSKYQWYTAYNVTITFTVLSSELEATSLPTAERAQHVTLSLWPLKSANTIPVDESHNCRERRV